MRPREGLQIAYLKLGDTVLELTHKSDGAMSGFHFCLETDNFDQTVRDLQKNGVRIGSRAPRYCRAGSEGRRLAPGGFCRAGRGTDRTAGMKAIFDFRF